jgi:hypothetical protein
LIASDTEIRGTVYKSLLLNCSTLACLYVFNLFFTDSQQWTRPNVGWIYQLIWVLPVFSVSFYLNVRRALARCVFATSSDAASSAEFMVLPHRETGVFLATHEPCGGAAAGVVYWGAQ